MICINNKQWISLDNNIYVHKNGVQKKIIYVFSNNKQIYPSDELVCYRFTDPTGTFTRDIHDVHRDTYAVFYIWQGYGEFCLMSRGNEIFRYSDASVNQRLIPVGDEEVYFSNIGLGRNVPSSWPIYNNTDQYGYDPELRQLWFTHGNATRERIYD